MPDYPKANTPKTKPQESWSPEQWINDDCKIKECIGGFISFENHGCSTVARCPKCDRAKNQQGDLMTGIPVYKGNITLRTESEMEERWEERRQIVYDRRVRHEMAMEHLTAGIGKGG